MNDFVVSLENTIVERAKDDPEALHGLFDEVIELFEEEDYTVCHRVLRTYLVASGKIRDIACFLNRDEADFLKTLDSEETLPKKHLSKIIEYLQLKAG